MEQRSNTTTCAYEQARKKAGLPYRITGSYLFAVIGIYAVTACSWLILWRVMSNRSTEKDSVLRSRVGQIWGGEHRQIAPSLLLKELSPTVTEASKKNNKSDTNTHTSARKTRVAQGKPSKAKPASKPAAVKPSPKTTTTPIPLACQASQTLTPARTRAMVHLDLAHRRKGLLWYSTYRVRFKGTYTYQNTTPCKRHTRLWIPFPAKGAVYDEFSVQHAGKELPLTINNKEGSGAWVETILEPGKQKIFDIRYNSRGLDQWSYFFGTNTSRAKDFKLVAQTNFLQIDFPEETLSPTRKEQHGDGWKLTWQFGNILADANIAIEMPKKINPGPLSAEISLFAPVSLGFFFFILLLVSVIKQVRLHTIHFAMLAAAFFSFHLLLAYMVDHLPLWASFSISSVTSVVLVVSYLRLAVGGRFALFWAGGAQLLYLVLFSLAFFLEGYTGLTITIFSILTLFAVMQLTGRIDWSSRLGKQSPRASESTSNGPYPDSPPPGPYPNSSPSSVPSNSPSSSEASFSRVG